ncbi:serine/threonine-protein kinase [Actinopolymorpha sp. NPDC004070]|uniref:serine/threonine-protein kinase n=1 Tax=Actinopolymorpha sp. NPDC004070 TaxID=3154548 RepID=UPI0033A8279C
MGSTLSSPDQHGGQGVPSGAATEERFATVLLLLVPDQSASRAAESELTAWSDRDWKRLLMDLPTDASSFLVRFERPWDAVIEDLHQWWTAARHRRVRSDEDPSSVLGYVGFTLLTLVSLRHSDEVRHGRTQADTAALPSTHDCEGICRPLVAEPVVRAAIRTLYGPQAGLGDDQALSRTATNERPAWKEWEKARFDELTFHRHGTTSFILTGTAEEVHGRASTYALKCLLHPFLRSASVVRSTDDYMAEYGQPTEKLKHVVRVWASSPNWILMDFVEGETLAEHLARRADEAPAARQSSLLRVMPKRFRDRMLRRRRASEERVVRVDLLEEVGRALLAALADLERVDLRHCDLSPSNIIVNADSGEYVLIDLGVNYLYVHAVAGQGGPDAGYVAPEVRRSGSGAYTSDLFSLGQLLVTAAAPKRHQDGFVPDSLYAETPILARFIEDLVDGEPTHRLSLFRPDPAEPLYPQLRTLLDEELAGVQAARNDRSTAPGLLADLVGLFRPLSGAPGSQWRLWKVRRRQGLYRDPSRGMHVRWLLFWAWLSGAAWYVAATIVLWWWARDLGWDWGNQAVTALSRLSGASPDTFPYLDDLRQPDYRVPDLVANLPARMVCLSFLLVCARYYQNLFAGLTPLVTGLGQGRLSRLAVLAEVHMRLATVVGLVLVVPTTLVQQAWWPVCTTIGMVVTSLCNWTCRRFAQTAVAEARKAGLSTVPSGRIAELEEFCRWAPSSTFYTFTVAVILVCMHLGVATDLPVYAAGVTLTNAVLFYGIKCSGNSAADVRAALGRACLAAERLRHTRHLVSSGPADAATSGPLSSPSRSPEYRARPQGTDLS